MIIISALNFIVGKLGNCLFVGSLEGLKMTLAWEWRNGLRYNVYWESREGFGLVGFN